MITKDTDLKTVAEITARLRSIDNQRESLESVWSPRDFNKHHAKIAKLTARYDKLWATRANLIKKEKL